MGFPSSGFLSTFRVPGAEQGTEPVVVDTQLVSVLTGCGGGGRDTSDRRDVGWGKHRWLWWKRGG